MTLEAAPLAIARAECSDPSREGPLEAPRFSVANGVGSLRAGNNVAACHPQPCCQHHLLGLLVSVEVDLPRFCWRCFHLLRTRTKRFARVKR